MSFSITNTLLDTPKQDNLIESAAGLIVCLIALSWTSSITAVQVRAFLPDDVFLNDLFDPPSLAREGSENASHLHY